MNKLKLGIIARLEKGADEEFEKARDLNLPTCQLVCWDESLFTEELADAVTAASEKHAVEITTVWVGYPGPAVWNFLEGPTTIGLVPPSIVKNASPHSRPAPISPPTSARRASPRTWASFQRRPATRSTRHSSARCARSCRTAARWASISASRPDRRRR